MFVLNVLTLLAAGSLVGNELAIAAFVHPALTRLSDDAHFASATALARVLGRAMPFWYALVTILTISVLLVFHHETRRWPLLIVASAGLWVLSIGYTVTALVPINNRIASWTEETRPLDWKVDRFRWDTLHRWRVLLLTVAFLFLSTGILQEPAAVK